MNMYISRPTNNLIMHPAQQNVRVKAYVPATPLQTEHRQWGRCATLTEAPGYKVKQLEIFPGSRLTLHYHRYNFVNWIVVSGTVTVHLAGDTTELSATQSVVMPVKVVLRVDNPAARPAVIVEVLQAQQQGANDVIYLKSNYYKDETGWRNK